MNVPGILSTRPFRYLLLATSFLPLCLAQTPPSQQPSVPLPTLRAQAHLVVVDVVVLDKSGTAVHGLKQADFTLAEDGATQTLKSFQEHTAAQPGRSFSDPPHLPPGTFSNFAPTPAASSINILLLDSLNTPMADQIYVRQQLADYVNHAKPGNTIAIFGLGGSLRMLQGSSSDIGVLRSAIAAQSSQASPLTTDRLGGCGSDAGSVDDLINSGAPLKTEVIAGLQLLSSQVSAAQLRNRVMITLEAMNQLGRYLANIPGRKNLIWFSGSFPLDLLPAASGSSTFGTDPFASLTSFEDEYRETTNLLARSQVAVYPIDARGIMVSPVFQSANSNTSPTSFRQDDNQFFQNTAEEHSTMERMAQDTGGEAFVNTNDLSQAVSRAIDLGSNYYTLAYSPANTAWKGGFRKIQVKLEGRGYKLSYRRGYFADDPNSPRSAFLADNATNGQPGPNPMQTAMQHGAPAPSQILFKVRVLPASTASEELIAAGNKPNTVKMKGPYRRYAIDFGAVPGNFLYPQTEDGTRKLTAEFVALLYDADGTLINSSVETANAKLTPSGFAGLQRLSIPSHQEISVPERGLFTLRLGIRDLNSGRIGATEVPLVAVKNLQPLSEPTSPAPPASHQ